MWLTILLTLLSLLLLLLLAISCDAIWGCREEENSNGFSQVKSILTAPLTNVESRPPDPSGDWLG